MLLEPRTGEKPRGEKKNLRKRCRSNLAGRKTSREGENPEEKMSLDLAGGTRKRILRKRCRSNLAGGKTLERNAGKNREEMMSLEPSRGGNHAGERGGKTRGKDVARTSQVEKYREESSLNLYLCPCLNLNLYFCLGLDLCLNVCILISA